MGDLLMASATASLGDGESKTVNLELERKVLELSTVTISQMPDEVTAVTVSVAPFYSGIRFNGSYVEESPLTYTFALAESATAGVWEAAPHQLAFPSKGVPTITVTFTRGETGSSSYTYTAENALTANNRYNISGTYTEPLGVTLEGAITLQAWTTDPSTIPFDFDESNAISDSGSGGSGTDDPNAGSGGSDNTDAPVAGQTYKGCYVVSVNETNHTAVLLSPTEKNGFADGNNDWKGYIESIVSNWPSVDGVTGAWRIPLLDEVNEFSKITGVVPSTRYFYCIQNSDLYTVRVAVGANGISLNEPKFDFGKAFFLRPVIDITY
jgi:hypothetical protein